MGKREKMFIPGEPIYARDMNEIINSTNHWHTNVDAQKHYLLNVGGIECLGDINIRGTFRINGVSIMAFRPVPEKVIIRETVEAPPQPPIIIRETVQESVQLAPGDNVMIENGVIHSDPGDWDQFVPYDKAEGQYIVFGPICFVQMHIPASAKLPAIRISLPFPAVGPVRQSLGGYMIVDRFMDLDGKTSHFISGAYRIA